jgi:hypothetical protein
VRAASRCLRRTHRLAGLDRGKPAPAEGLRQVHRQAARYPCRGVGRLVCWTDLEDQQIRPEPAGDRGGRPATPGKAQSERIAADADDLFADYEVESGRRLDPQALDLVCLGSLAQMGFRMANSASYARPETRAIGVYQLDWWVRRVRTVLDALPY